jgi:excisionase family DNA binding protein
MNRPTTGAQRITNPVGALKKRLFTLKEAGEYLGRSLWAVREMVWAGKLPCVKDGRRVLLDVHDLNAWIEKNKSTFSY